MKKKNLSPLQYSLLFIIQLHRALRPFWLNIQLSIFGFAPVCHQRPSCSEYTRQEIIHHGTITGLKKGLKRIISCHS